MKKVIIILASALTLALFVVGSPSFTKTLPSTKAFAAELSEEAKKCLSDNTFFGLKPWHAYLEKEYIEDTGECKVKAGLQVRTGDKTRFERLWLIGLAILDDLLRIAGLVAVSFVIYGGFRFMLSRGQPDNTKAAISTITNALIGLAIAMVGAAVVGFIGNKLKGQS